MKARRLAGVVLFAATVFTLPDAAGATAPVATGGRVQLLQPSVVSPRARRCLTRLREELTAGGFQVVVSEFGVGGDALWVVDASIPRDGSLATITLMGNPDEGPAELWIVDGVAGGRAAVRRLLLPAGSTAHDDEVLAVRTLEFLRASALELARGTPAAPPPSPTPMAPPAATASAVAPEGPRASVAAPAAPPARRPFSFEVGLSLLASSRSLEPAYLPVAGLRAELASFLESRVTLAGFGTRPEVTRLEGTAAIGHTLGLVELRTAFRRGRAVRPTVGVGGGVLVVQVDSAGMWPYEGRSGRTWAGLFGLSAGLTIALGRRLAVAAEVQGQVAAPYPSVRFSEVEAARIGRPALFTSLTLVTPL